MLRNTFSTALLAVMLVVLVAGNVQAQTTPTATVTATAIVRAALGITENLNVNFGAVAVSTTPVLDPQGLASAYIGVGATVGEVTIGSQANAQIRVTWPATLTLTSGANTLTYTLQVNGDDGGLSQATAVPLTLTGTYLDITPTHNTYVLWVGGSLGLIPALKPAGTYTNLTQGVFTVEYN